MNDTVTDRSFLMGLIVFFQIHPEIGFYIIEHEFEFFCECLCQCNLVLDQIGNLGFAAFRQSCDFFLVDVSGIHVFFFSMVPVGTTKFDFMIHFSLCFSFLSNRFDSTFISCEQS